MTTKPKPTEDENDEGLSTGVPTRLYNSDHAILKDLENAGINMSIVIRRCVNKALPQVAAEIASEITRSVKKP